MSGEADVVERARAQLARLVRDVPDFPEPGVLFKDITPVLGDPVAFGDVVAGLAALAHEAADGPIDKVVGIEARGFILGAPVALELGAGFVAVRKAGKLPGPSHAVTYDLEYGSATLEVHDAAVAPGERVTLLDDVLATGGTVAAARELVERCGGRAVAATVLLELSFLPGREALGDLPLRALQTV